MDQDIFITEDFLLENETARRLFHEYSKNMPIIDYHCHLIPEQVAEDRQFENLSQIWLAGDHYKWRAMRANGVPERFCTGDGTDWEKFEHWAATVPKTLRNPLYHWTHMELKRPFGISDRLLGPDTAESIWDECEEKLASPEFSSRGIMSRMNVVLVCTTDDPTDTLEHHKTVADDQSFNIQMLPTWRPDKGMAVEDPPTFNAWVDMLEEASGCDINGFVAYIAALRRRHDYFHSVGCRLSDHGLDTIYADDYTDIEIIKVFDKIRSGETLDRNEIKKFKSAMLLEFGIMDHEKEWTQQFHLGARRNNSSRMFEKLGPDTGFDSMGDWQIADPLGRLLDRLDSQDQLAKTILYNLNPCDNAVLMTMAGNFQDARTPGKMQFGSGWWHLDQRDGMLRQMEDLSNMGLLSRFVGMLTDSRSFLSYPRHEYFRRILCNLLGTEMERGLLPNDINLIGQTVQNISYKNAANYFGFNLDPMD